MKRRPVLVFGLRLATLNRAIESLQTGQATAALEGVTYTPNDLSALYSLAEWWGVKAAIEAIQQGAQSYTLAGLMYTRANLKDLVARDEQLRERAVGVSRRGPGIGYAVFG